MRVAARAWPAVLVVAALALYANALRNPFLSDDTALIGENVAVTAPTLASLARLWTLPYTQGLGRDGSVVALLDEDPTGTLRTVYRPITTSSYWANALLTGASPLGFRVANVLLHALAAWLLGLWTARLVGGRSDDGYAAAGAPGPHVAGPLSMPPVGIAVSALVLVHPLATDVVNRIAGRADVLMVVGVAGFLATQLAAEQRGWTWRRTTAGALWVAVALGAKESGAIVLPLALAQATLRRAPSAAHVAVAAVVPRSAHKVATTPAADASRVRTRVWTRRGGAARGTRWGGTLAIAVPAVAYAVARTAVLKWAPYVPAPQWDLVGNPLIGKPLAARLPAIGALTLDYVRLLVAPWPLFAFDSPPVPTRLDAWAVLGLVVLATLSVASVALAWRRRPLALAATWFVATFAVVAHVLTPIFAYREVRFAYDMLGALAVTTGCLAATLRISARRVSATPAPAGYTQNFGRAFRVAARAALAAAVAGGALAVVVRNRDFASLDALLAADLRERPASAAAMLRLADSAERRGRAAQAEQLYRGAVAAAPWSEQAKEELGAFLLNQGRRDEAATVLRQAIEIAPSSAALVTLSRLALDRGDVASAADYLGRAQRIAPDDPYVSYNLAVVADERGDRAEAIRLLEQTLVRHPEFRLARDGLAQLR